MLIDIYLPVFISLLFDKNIKIKQEGHDGSVLLHWQICKIPSYQTSKYLGIGLKHKIRTKIGSPEF